MHANGCKFMLHFISAIMPLNLVLGLYMLPTNLKIGISLFGINLIILFVTAGTDWSTSIPCIYNAKQG